MSTPTSAIRALWVALGLMLALLVGVAAGILAWMGGQHPAAAVLTGGAAFGGTVALTLMVKKALIE